MSGREDKSRDRDREKYIYIYRMVFWGEKGVEVVDRSEE